MTRRVRRRHRELRGDPLTSLAWFTALTVVIGIVTAGYVIVRGGPPSSSSAELAIVETLALDYMSGADGSGWGGAEVGGGWSLEPVSAFSTDDGAGVIALDRTRSTAAATLSAVVAQDTLMSAKVVIPFISTSESSVSFVLRSVEDGAYRAVLTPRGATEVELRLERGAEPMGAPTVLAREDFARTSTSASLIIEFSTIGTQPVEVRARAWEPSVHLPLVDLRATDASSTRLAAPGAVLLAGTRGGEEFFTVQVDDVKVFDVSPRTTGEVAPIALGELPTRLAIDGKAGSARVGSTTYPVPAGAVVVAQSGDDSADGSWSQPFRSLATAVERAHPGSTVVVRGGVYHEAIVIGADKYLTLQSAPGEEVWLDGTGAVDSFEKVPSGWAASNWLTRFDSSPTYTRGAGDNERDGWRFVSAKHPMAAHPDQVWIDGVAQTQVGSKRALRAGTFFADYGASLLVLGEDPDGREVRAGVLERAVRILSTDVVVRGFGVRGYSPSVPQLGAITVESARATVENIEIRDSATTGLFLRDPGSVVRQVTVTRSGMLGIAVSYADDILIDAVVSTQNNIENFNQAPVSGGMKVTRSRGVTVSDSIFGSNAGPGLWFDESVFDGVVARNQIDNNTGHGLVMEISAKFIVADNLILDNARNGIKLNNTSDVQIWHNTLSGNSRALNIVQDARRAADKSTPGHDPRQVFPDPTMTWVIDSVIVSNNVMGRSTGNCLLCVEDYSKTLTAEQMGLTVSGNVFQRGERDSPAWLIVWSDGPEINPSVYPTLDGFVKDTSEKAAGIELTGVPAIDRGGRVLPEVEQAAAAVVQPVPTDIRQILGVEIRAEVGALRR